MLLGPSCLLCASRIRPLRSSLHAQVPIRLASKPSYAFPTQRRFAGSEPTKITEDEQLQETRQRSDEGAILATQSGLFKLLLPLPGISDASLAKRLSPTDDSAVLFLLHPRQPLSVISSLIASEVSPKGSKPVDVTFHGVDESTTKSRESGPQTPIWSQATELGDFVQEAAKDTKFVVVLHEEGHPPQVTPVRVPTFKQRTQYLRDRLRVVTREMQSLLEIKTQCDDLALHGAKRAAFAGFGGLAAYWGTVYYLTFYKYGWDLMEPVTYLTGLTGIMGGYLWFLYHQREISYRSVFEMSSSRRREQLYDQKGFDRQAWRDLVDEGTELRRAIKKIAHDYSTKWSMNEELDDDKAVEAIKKNENQHEGSKQKENAEANDEADQDATKSHKQ